MNSSYTQTLYRSLNNRQGFTLIEVLIAILILALGLLGLGAVFPVIITQQRNAVSIVEGEGVASMTESVLRNSPEIIDFSPWFDPASTFGLDGSGDMTYEWVVDPLVPYDSYDVRPGFGGGLSGSADGFWYFNLEDIAVPPTNSTDLNKALSVTDRLIPQPFSGKDPKYVWDVVARRQPGTNRPQLAIFVRPVDLRIRAPRNATLSDVLVRGAGTDDPVLPVALDLNTGRPAVDDGRSTSGNLVYAAPQTLQVQVMTDHLDWLVIEDANNMFFDTSVSFATKPGQKLLDNTGTVRTVLGPATGPDADDLRNRDTRVLRVDPPFQFTQAAVESASYTIGSNNPSTDSERASWVRQIVFTPRTPLAIRVITLEGTP